MTETAPYSPKPFAEVKITGPFWRERLDTVLTRTIPSQHAKLDEVGILESIKLPKPIPPLRIPLNSHNFTMQVFWDSDVGKWIEAASYALAHRRDPDIEVKIDAIVDDLARAQAPDGYPTAGTTDGSPKSAGRICATITSSTTPAICSRSRSLTFARPASASSST